MMPTSRKLMRHISKVSNVEQRKLEYEFKCRLAVDVSKIFEDRRERFPR